MDVSLLTILDTHSHAIMRLTYSPHGDSLACGYRDGGVESWDLATGKSRVLYVESAASYSDPILCIAFSPDGSLLAAANVGYYPARVERAVQVWRTTDGVPVFRPGGFQWWIYAVAFSSDGALLAVGGDDQWVKLYNTRTGEERGPYFPQMNYSISSLAFSPDGGLLLAGCDGCEINVLSLETGQVKRTLEGHVEWTRALAFHPERPLFASGGEDGRIALWDAPSGQLLRELRNPGISNGMWWGHNIYDLAFSPDGTLLASASADDLLELWNVALGERVAWARHDGVKSVAFSPDGMFLASGGDDRTIRLWRIES